MEKIIERELQKWVAGAYLEKVGLRKVRIRVPRHWWHPMLGEIPHRYLKPMGNQERISVPTRGLIRFFWTCWIQYESHLVAALIVNEMIYRR